VTLRETITEQSMRAERKTERSGPKTDLSGAEG